LQQGSLGGDDTGSVLNVIRGWFVGPEVKEIAKLTHLLTAGIKELEGRVIPEHAWTKSEELAKLNSAVKALKASFLQTMAPYVGPWWQKWKSYAINVADAKAVEAILRQQNQVLMSLARRFEEITGTRTNVPREEPKVREDTGLIDLAVTVGGWAVGLGLLWYGGRALFKIAEGRYAHPPKYARR
jgi:hypothetical protein